MPGTPCWRAGAMETGREVVSLAPLAHRLRPERGRPDRRMAVRARLVLASRRLRFLGRDEEMVVKAALALGTPSIDVTKFVVWNESPFRTRYRVASGDRRAGQSGVLLGTIVLPHAGGYECVLQMDSGRIESFAAMALFPEIADADQA